MFDDVDAKYGIPEEEREKLEKSGQLGGNAPGEAPGGMGGMGGGPSSPGPIGGAEASSEPPLSESYFINSKKSKIL